MRKFFPLLVSLFMVFFLVSPVAAAPLASSSQTYTVLVGAENTSSKVGIMSFFPGTLKVHVGDTVVWKVQTHEIHTVSFLAGGVMPDLLIPAPAFGPAAMQFNPAVAFPAVPTGGMYDGTTFANSGILSTDPGQSTQFSLTFTQPGSFPYLCLVHGMMMSGTIEVVNSLVSIPSPSAVLANAKVQMTVQLAMGQKYIGQGMALVPAPVHHSDGTTSYTVMIGYSKGHVDLMRFFPDKLVVHPGDTVNFMLSPTDGAPHTVTFLNGNPDISLLTVVPGNPPVLLLNSQVEFPIQPGVPLSSNGVFSSGLLAPGSPFTSYSLTIGSQLGTFNYQCLLHDTSGMDGVIQVVGK